MEGLLVTRNTIEEYLNARPALTENTRSTYRARLNQLYDLLPQDKIIRRGTIQSTGELLLQRGYSKKAVNVVLAVADGFVVWSGHPEFQAVTRYEPEDTPQPLLSRSEYQRLLMAARRLGRERDYLLIKTIALTGANLPEVLSLDGRSLAAGTLCVSGEPRPIPRPLQEELTSYARRHPSPDAVFQSHRGAPLSRVAVTQAIKSLAGEARVEESKCNPRCLRKLYLDTQAHYRTMVQTLMDQTAARQLESEQRLIGWVP
ncbi:MAG: hypothetical protein IJR17_07125 [Clostridia bacterium]|nr:hypothetical protein [Clostridia bacterium]